MMAKPSGWTNRQSKKPALCLADFLGEATRNEGHEQFTQWVDRLVRQSVEGGDDLQIAWIMLTRAWLIATVETNNELWRLGTKPEDLFAVFPRAAGFAVASALYSAVDEKCPRNLQSRMLRQGVRDGINLFFEAVGEAG